MSPAHNANALQLPLDLESGGGARSYQLYLPTEDELRKELEALRKEAEQALRAASADSEGED